MNDESHEEIGKWQNPKIGAAVLVILLIIAGIVYGVEKERAVRIAEENLTAQYGSAMTLEEPYICSITYMMLCGTVLLPTETEEEVTFALATGNLVAEENPPEHDTEGE